MEFQATELTSYRWVFTVKDETGAVIPGASFAEVFLWIYDIATGTIVNNRDGSASVLGGIVTISAQGDVVVQFTPADFAVLNSAAPAEMHRAVLDLRLSNGRRKVLRRRLYVENESKITA